MRNTHQEADSVDMMWSQLKGASDMNLRTKGMSRFSRHQYVELKCTDDKICGKKKRKHTNAKIFRLSDKTHNLRSKKWLKFPPQESYFPGRNLIVYMGILKKLKPNISRGYNPPRPKWSRRLTGTCPTIKTQRIQVCTKAPDVDGIPMELLKVRR